MDGRCSWVLGVVALGCASTPASSAAPDAGSPADAPSMDDGGSRSGSDSATVDSGVVPEAAVLPDAAGVDARVPGDATADAAPCTTRVSYGSAWIRPANHPSGYDDVQANVTWDGTCTDDGADSFALLSNGFKPYFQGNGACVLALDHAGSCGSQPACTTRVTYGAAWVMPPNHPNAYDDVPGRVFSDGTCQASGGVSTTNLSNGWQPHFTGAGTCRLSFEYSQCGGLYANPVIPTDCPDPGVLYSGGQYYLSCTSGGAPDAYPIYSSPDLATWTLQGHIFPAGHWPAWATGSFWAPEIHVVGGHFVAYFSARNGAGMYSIGAASATSPLGPYTDIGQPLVQAPAMGLIDASEITSQGGTPYALWKEDGNAVGKPTPIHAQALAADGLSLVAGSPATLITNDQPWEGAVTEAPFMVYNGGSYYLFYSGNSYANASYAVGVASAASPLGPFTKASAPIVVTGGGWAGPGHCAVVDTPAGDTYMVYHAWQSGCVNGPGCGRLVLTDAVFWTGGWPAVPFAPSSASRPMP